MSNNTVSGTLLTVIYS